MIPSGGKVAFLLSKVGILLPGLGISSPSAGLATCFDAQYNIVETERPAYSACAADHFTTVVNRDDPTRSYRQYVSSQAQPPVVKVNKTERPLSTGFLFITPEMFSPVVHRPVPAALIITGEGDLVWSASFDSPGAMIINLEPQKLYGRPVITYWNGTQGHVQGYGAGTVEVLDESYQRIFSVCPNLNITIDTPMSPTTKCFCDYHEALITRDNTMLITIYNKTTADLTSIGGPKDGYVVDSLAVEVDIETNEALFVWRALDHVPISHSRRQAGKSGTESDPYDWFHINSIQPWEDGFLINSRHTWSTYYISREGEIIWRIDGAKGGDFGDLPHLGHFSWQHDARLRSLPDGRVELTYFANNERSSNGPGSIALGLSLDFPPNTSTPPSLSESLFDPNHPIQARAGGSHQVLANGNRLVGYGDQPFIKEFGPAADGHRWEVRWTAQLPYTRHSYRAFKQDWHARPSDMPELVVRRVEESTPDQLTHCAGDSRWRGYVSWNGATDVTQYTIYSDFGDGNMRKVAAVARAGFETVFVVPDNAVRLQIAVRECPGGAEVRRSRIVFIQ